MQVIRGVVDADDVEAGPAQVGQHHRLGEIVRVIDLHRVLDRPVPQVCRPEVDDVDEQQPAVADQLAHPGQRPRHVEQVVDGLADQYEIEATAAEIERLDQPGGGLDTQPARALDLERRRIDDQAAQPEGGGEMAGDDAGRAADVEHRAQAGRFEKRSRERGRGARVLLLLRLNRVGVDQPAVERADQRPVDPVVEPAVGLAGHARVEEHQPAPAAGVRLGRVAVAIALGDDNEAIGAAQVAGLDRACRLGGVVEAERRDAGAAAGRWSGRRHQ